MSVTRVAVFLCLLVSCTPRVTASSIPNEPATASPTPSPSTAPQTPAAASQRAAQWPPIPADAMRAHVSRVVDGDTIVVVGIRIGRPDSGGRPGRHARLIGVDTPEIYGGVQCYARLASAFTKELLAGGGVMVDFDVGVVDRYARALVYVWKLDGTFVNGALVREGYASQLTVPPNVRYVELFTRYTSEARTARRGLWSAC